MPSPPQRFGKGNSGPASVWVRGALWGLGWMMECAPVRSLRSIDGGPPWILHFTFLPYGLLSFCSIEIDRLSAWLVYPIDWLAG